MDMWVVAAAAGAGCLVKYWQNVLKEQKGLSGFFLGNTTDEKSKSKVSASNQPTDQKWREPGISYGCDQSCVFAKRMHRPLGEESSLSGEETPSSLVERLTDTLRMDVPCSSADDVASTSGNDGGTMSNSVKCEEGNLFFFSSSQPPFVRNDNCRDDGDIVNEKSGYDPNDQVCLSQPHLYPRKTVTGYEYRRDRTSRKCKWSRRHLVKPQNSLESCLIAQLFKESNEMEEYVFNSLPSLSTSMPIMRPLVITDGNQIISKASYGSPSGQFENRREDSGGNETGNGIMPLPHLGLIELARKLKKGKVNIRHTRRSCLKSESEGLPQEILLFFLGISIGVISTILSSKREVDKLNNLLKQTQNLVQDLHEELEMKDSMTMEELANVPCTFQEINCPVIMESAFSPPYQAQTGFPPDQVAYESMLLDDEEAHAQDEKEKVELMSKIEAELEAELERLELNINASSLERRLSELGELDPDMAEVVCGELGPDKINRGAAADSDHYSEGSSTDHTHPANYAVSPRELSLRLHELIQSRLEERISELESALEDSQKRLWFMEAQRDFSNSDLGSPSTQESPTMMEHADVMSSPLYLNLAGDALNAYNEAYTEFLKVTEATEEHPLSRINGCKQMNDEINLLNQTPRQDWMRRENGSLPNPEICGTVVPNGLFIKEADDHEDEVGMLLIKQIVEKTRQGSPAVLNAQRMMYSLDEQ